MGLLSAIQPLECSWSSGGDVKMGVAAATCRTFTLCRDDALYVSHIVSFSSHNPLRSVLLFATVYRAGEQNLRRLGNLP